MVEQTQHTPLDRLQWADLRAAMLHQGCPVCRSAFQGDVRNHRWYIGDGAVDQRTMARMRGALGPCGWHASTIAMLEGEGWVWSHLGIAVIFEHVLTQRILPRLPAHDVSRRKPSRYLHRVSVWRTKSALRAGEPCPVCSDSTTIEQREVDAFRRGFLTESTFRARYAQSSGLCLPHLLVIQRTMSTHPDGDIVAALVEPVANNLRTLAAPAPGDAIRPLASALYGAITPLWMQQIDRLPVPESTRDCELCRALWTRQHERARYMVRDDRPLRLCGWHGWIIAAIGERQAPDALTSAMRTLAASTLAALTASGPDVPDSGCDMCAWQVQDDKLLIDEWEAGRGDMPAVCLQHGRRLLDRARHGDSTREIDVAITHEAYELATLLRRFITHCSEDKQRLMSQDERHSWYRAACWFGGPRAMATLEALKMLQIAA